MGKSILVQVRVDRELAQKFDEFASAAGSSRAHALRLLMQEALYSGGHGGEEYITLRIPDLDVITDLAEREGISVSSWIQRAVKKARNGA